MRGCGAGAAGAGAIPAGFFLRRRLRPREDTRAGPASSGGDSAAGFTSAGAGPGSVTCSVPSGRGFGSCPGASLPAGLRRRRRSRFHLRMVRFQHICAMASKQMNKSGKPAVRLLCSETLTCCSVLRVKTFLFLSAFPFCAHSVQLNLLRITGGVTIFCFLSSAHIL